MNLPINSIFSLQNFEGPLDFLFHLIQKNEIDILHVSLQEITEQFLKKLKELTTQPVQEGAEFIGTTSYLMLLKSRSLLPEQQQAAEEEEAEDLLNRQMIEQLIEYCRFKEMAKKLSALEWQHKGCYTRGVSEAEDFTPPKKFLGVETLSLQDLFHVFEETMQKASSRFKVIEGEEWHLPDAMQSIKSDLQKGLKIAFKELFSLTKSRQQLIITFLALLELMKQGSAQVFCVHSEIYIQGQSAK